MSLIYGATQTEWDAAIALAKADLLPYLADPRVKCAAYSRITPGMKTPGYVNQSTGEGVGIIAWPKHVARDRHLLEWRADPRHGICLICRNLRAIDIDIVDEAKADEVEDFILDHLNLEAMPCRTRSDSGKRTLLYRISDAPGPLRKWAIPTNLGPIEFLFDKQQTVIAGRHPEGQRYEWLDGFPTTADVPVLEMDRVVGLVSALQAEFGASDFTRRWGILSAPELPRGAPRDIPTDPAVAFLAENDLIVDYADDGGLYVKCPWEHEHTGETKYDAAKYYPAGLGRIDAGYNCFHAHCQGRNHHDFLDAVGFVDSEFEVIPDSPAAQGLAPRPRLTYKSNSGIIEGTLENIVKVLQWADGTGIKITYDSFKDAVLYKIDDAPWAELTDDTYTLLRLKLTALGMDAMMGKQNVVDAVSYVAKQNQVDSAQEWLKTKRWDGIPRIRDFHVKCLRLADTRYHEAVSNYLWTALAGRVLEPGVKCDMILVLSGPQGQRKSTFCEALCPSAAEAVEVNLSLKDADLARMMRGKLVGEWAELRGLDTRDAESIKGWVTQRYDEWVPKYKEFGTVRPRRFILVGTSNRRRYLNDPTGARRYLPVNVTATYINTDWLTANKEQLWAEGAELFQQYGVMWQEAERLGEAARRDAEYIDAWTDAIAQWLAEDGRSGYSAAVIANRAVHVPLPAVTPQVQRRIARVMTYLGWVENSQGRWECDLV